MAIEHGPYLQVAAFCERVLAESDGVLSLIRIVDRIIQTVSAPEAPESMPSFSYNLTAVIALKAGDARGSLEVRMEMEDPSGIRTKGPTMTTHLEGEDRGQNLVFNMQMNFTSPGLYWFNVYVDNQLLTRMPLRVVYTRIGGPVAPPVPR